MPDRETRGAILSVLPFFMTRLALLLLFCLLLCECATAPAVAPPAAADAGPPPEVSTITVPIRASLAPLLPLIEAQVPAGVVKTDAYELDPSKRFGLRYKVTRDPITLEMIGPGLHAKTTARYALEGCKRTVNPITGAVAMWPCVSCGFGEPMREAAIALHSRFEWDAQWRLRSQTTAMPVEFPNRCTVTFFNLDLSSWKLAPLVDAQMRGVAAAIDRNTPQLTNLRPTAQQIWSTLQTPAQIAPKTWLVLDPVDVALAPLRGSGLNVSSVLSLQARTRVIVGERPVTRAKPLPPLHSAPPGAAQMRVPFDLEISYADASRLLTAQFGHRTYGLGGGATLAVETLRLEPGANGKLLLDAEIHYRGGRMKHYDGMVRLEGLPSFDPAARTVGVDSLDYQPRGRRLADRFAHASVRDRLRASARWSIAAEIDTLRAAIERGLTRPLSAGVTLRGRVDSLEPSSITPLARAISIRLVATGSAEVEVREWK
jgi:hypothetical protein